MKEPPYYENWESPTLKASFNGTPTDQWYLVSSKDTVYPVWTFLVIQQSFTTTILNGQKLYQHVLSDSYSQSNLQFLPVRALQ